MALNEVGSAVKETPLPEGWPEKIRMRGMPIMWQGWNCVFTYSGQLKEGCPVYRLDEYILYGSIVIIGATIKKHAGVWIMQRDCDPAGRAITSKSGRDQAQPIGKWSVGRVTTQTAWILGLFV